MGPTFQDPRIVVYDNLLSPDHLRSVWEQVQREKYKVPERNGDWIKVWRLTDGVSVSSADYRHSKRPFAGALETIAARVVELARKHPEIAGREGADWVDITLRAYLYPRGSKLSWHDDTASYTGAFSFYAHPIWGSTWGGELLVADTSGFEAVREGATTGPYLDREWEDRYLLGNGHGRFFSAKPNRLVLSSAGLYHAINRVDPDAGDHVRASISGFFMRPEARP